MQLHPTRPGASKSRDHDTRADRRRRAESRRRSAVRRLALDWLEDRLAPSLTIVPHFGASISSAPLAVRTAVVQTINSAIQMEEGYISNTMTVNVDFEINSGSILSIGVAPGGGGSGYTAATQVMISAPTAPSNSGSTAGLGIIATATPILGAGGSILGFNLTNNGGWGYTASSPPVVTLGGGGGSGFVEGPVRLNLGLGRNYTKVGNVTYASYVQALGNQFQSANDQIADPTLPAGNSYPAPLGGPAGGNLVQLPIPLARALGYSGVSNAAFPMDGAISLNTNLTNNTRPDADATRFDLLTLTLHELDEVLSYGSALNGHQNTPGLNPAAISPIDPMDLFRYSPPTRNATTGASVAGARL